MESMKILAIETATEACSVALWIDGEVTERHEIAPRLHAERVLTDSQALLGQAGLALGDLDGIAMGRGPGSFTGVRIAASMVQGLALGADLPVAPVSTLAALALGVMREHDADRVIASLDARMREVYLARFTRASSGLPEPASDEIVIAPEDAPVPDSGGWLGAGHGFRAQQEALRERLAQRLSGVYADILPRARDVAALAVSVFESGGGLPAENALPVYVREKVAEKPRGSKDEG